MFLQPTLQGFAEASSRSVTAWGPDRAVPARRRSPRDCCLQRHPGGPALDKLAVACVCPQIRLYVMSLCPHVYRSPSRSPSRSPFRSPSRSPSMSVYLFPCLSLSLYLSVSLYLRLYVWSSVSVSSQMLPLRRCLHARHYVPFPVAEDRLCVSMPRRTVGFQRLYSQLSTS